ncbi:putative G-protein gamma [Plasmopara halstedii]
MSDATTKKLTEEIARLESDLKTLEASCTTSEAAKKIAGYCQSTADPFLGENEGGVNPWQQSGQGGGGCSIL